MENKIYTESEKADMFNLLWQQSLVGICLVSEGGKFIAANPKTCELLEYTESELQSMTFMDITHAADRRADADMLSKVLSGERNSYGMFKVYGRKMRGWLSAFLWVTAYTKDRQFVCFISQIMPVESGEKPALEVAPIKVSGFWPFVKEYWTQALFIGGLVFAGVVECVKLLWVRE